MAPKTYSLQALQLESGVSARTLRYWIRQRILPKPVGRGRGTRYDERHLLRARAALSLRRKRLALAEVRTRLAAMSEDELRSFTPPAPRLTTADGVPVPPPATTYPAAMWEVVELMDGMVLMVNPNRGPVVRRVADEIYRHYSMPKRPQA